MFEPVPDEPENNTQWDAYYTNLETTEGKAAFNTFITDSIDQLNEIFISNGVSGVITNFTFTNPSVAKNVITDATADTLTFIGTNNYPTEGAATPAAILAAWQTEI